MDLNELSNKLTNIKLTSETLDQSIQTLEQYQKKETLLFLLKELI